MDRDHTATGSLFLTVVTKLLTPQAATDEDFEATYNKAIEDAAAYCPALKN